MATTTFHYSYRDAAGYASYGSWTVPGLLSEEQVAEIRETFDGEFFVPLAVGMPMLSPGGDQAGEDDHALHTLDEIRTGDLAPDDSRSAEAVVESFRRADWAGAMTSHALGHPTRYA